MDRFRYQRHFVLPFLMMVLAHCLSLDTKSLMSTISMDFDSQTAASNYTTNKPYFVC